MGLNEPGQTRPVKVAIVGAGYMAAEHARAFAAIAGARIVGVFSRSAERSKQIAAIYPTLSVCDSVDDLWHKTRADLVVVAVNELSMREVATACFAFPWAVLLEKPAGYDLDDAIQIVAEAQKANARVFVALNRRAYSSTRLAIGQISQIPGRRFVKVLDQEDQVAALNVHKNPKAVVDNWMFANSIHLIDYFRIFGRGEITRVTPVVPWNPSSPGIVVAKIDFSSGDLGLYEGIWDGPGPWAVTVNTPELRLEMRPVESLALQRRGERRLEQIVTDPLDTEFKPGLHYQARQALAAVRGETTELATLEDATESMRLCAAIFGL